MTAEKTDDVKSLKDDSPIIFYTFEYLSDSARFHTLLEERFRNTGHTRRIEFRPWDCYHEIPDTDGDIYVYDACTMSALVDKGIIRGPQQDQGENIRFSVHDMCERVDMPKKRLYPGEQHFRDRRRPVGTSEVYDRIL